MTSYQLLDQAVKQHLTVIIENKNPSTVETSARAISLLTQLIDITNKSIAHTFDATQEKWRDRIVYAVAMFIGTFVGTLIARIWL